ncbi:MAG: DUF1127 domain-containing protein [Rhodobacteraceae bacterium]|nr:DUF1127 domain-containing protein [Paracoccaceae bacterium]
MAYVNSRTARPTLGERIQAWWESSKDYRARYATYRRTVRELESMSDRDLADIGISRSQIADIAAEAAFGR